MSARWDENLDKAYERFRQSHEALRDALLASLPAHTDKETRIGAAQRLRRPVTGGFIMNSRTAKLAVAAAIVIAVLLGLHYLGGGPVGTTVAWADVLAQMDAGRTVTFNLESERQYEEDGFYWARSIVKIKDPYRRSDGVDGHRYGDGPAHEDSNMCISDLSRQNRFIILYPAWKLAEYAPDHGDNDTLMTYDGLKQDFRDGTEEALGTVEIDGREAVCFRVSKGDRVMTVWADPETALPLRIERVATEGVDKTILSNIAFDVELSDDLFDMTPPDDYCVMNMATEEFRVPFELTETHLIDELATSAKSLGGKFPTRFGRGRPGEEAIEKAFAEMRQAAPVEGRSTPMLGTEFLKRLPEDSDWKYVGEDVKLGDASKAICWYRPEGSATYRVIYGDLSVKDVAPEDLPPIPWLTDNE